MIEDVTTTGCTLIRTAEKFEAGTPNLMGAIGLQAAVEFYKDHDIYAYNKEHKKMINDSYQQLLDRIGYDTMVG